MPLRTGSSLSMSNPHFVTLTQSIKSQVTIEMDVNNPIDQAHSTRSFNFFGLPFELRTKVYQCLLAPTEFTIISKDDDKDAKYKSPGNIYPQILRTRKACYDEAIPILYRKHGDLTKSGTLVTYNIHWFAGEFLPQIGTQNSARIRSVICTSSSTSLNDYLQFKQLFRQLPNAHRILFIRATVNPSLGYFHNLCVEYTEASLGLLAYQEEVREHALFEYFVNIKPPNNVALPDSERGKHTHLCMAFASKEALKSLPGHVRL